MEYPSLLRALYHAGYVRIERDDRLLDVFPRETREKGVELWIKVSSPLQGEASPLVAPEERSGVSRPEAGRRGQSSEGEECRHCEVRALARAEAISSSIKILRISCPFNENKLSLFSVPKKDLEALLINNKTSSLNDFPLIASGKQIMNNLAI